MNCPHSIGTPLLKINSYGGNHNRQQGVQRTRRKDRENRRVFFSSKATIRKLRKTYLVRQRPTCRYARISTRTLQRLRKDNQIAYTKLRRKCIYRLSDVRESVNSRIVTCDPQTMDDYYKNYMLVTNGKKGGLL